MQLAYCQFAVCVECSVFVEILPENLVFIKIVQQRSDHFVVVGIYEIVNPLVCFVILQKAVVFKIDQVPRCFSLGIIEY